MNQVEKINDRLGELWSGYIKNLHHNLYTHSISFDVYIYTAPSKIKIKVDFQKVSTHLVHYPEIHDSEEYIWDVIEITSTEYLPKSLYFKTMSKKHPNTKKLHMKGECNIFIECWRVAIFIKAEKLKINEEIFELA